MPEEEKKTVPIDTSGPDATIDIAEEKDESVVETEAPKQESETIEQETDKTYENERETKLDKKDSEFCLLYTSPSPRDGLLSRMPSSA